jgi:hypothetical protein
MGWRQRQHRGLPNGRVAPGRAPGSEIAAGPRPSAPSGCMKGLRSTPGLSIGTAAIAIVMAACRLILVSLRKSSASRGAPGWRGPRRFQPTSLRDDRRSAGQQDGQGSRSRRAGRPRDPHLLQLSGHSLAEDQNQQSAGADHERDQAQNPRRRRLPRWSVLSQPGGRATTVHRRNDVVGQMLHEHAAMIECAKDSGHYQRYASKRASTLPS